MAKKVTIYSIAKEAGVSVPTVSRVINRKAGITEATRKKVNDLLLHYNFRPEYPAMRTIKLAVLYPIPELSDYFRNAMKGIYAYSQDHELMVNIIIVNSPRKESLLQAVREQQCSGVIAMMPEHYRREFEEFEGTDLPVVVIDSVSNVRNIGFIDNDSSFGSAAAASHLIELGHRKIGYLSYYEPEPPLNHLMRFKSAYNTFLAHGIELEKKRIVQPASRICRTRGYCGLVTMNKLLEQAPDTTAVMTCDDAIALGAITAIHKAGLRVPEDISVVGFDNYPETEFWFPALTTVDHPIEKEGFMAAEAVYNGLTSPMANWTPPREILPTSLVIRESTGPAKK